MYGLFKTMLHLHGCKLITHNLVMQAVEDMCLHKMADRLYNNLQKVTGILLCWHAQLWSGSCNSSITAVVWLKVCDVHIASQLQQLADNQTSDCELFLEEMNECWQDHCSQMLTIRSIFLYLDRTYVISDAAVRSIFDMGLSLFRVHLAIHPEVHALNIMLLCRQSFW